MLFYLYMKSINQFITERFVTLFYDKIQDKDLKLKYSKEVYDMIVKSYEYIGGLAGCRTYDDFVQQYVEDVEHDNLIWKLVRRSDKITAVKIYATKRGGRKGVVIATDGSEQGKKDISKIMEEDYKLKDRQAWEEVSGKALGAALKKGGCPLPNYTILELMHDKDPKMFRMREDGFFYDRWIKDGWHTKVLIGYPPTHIKGEQVDKEFAEKLKALGKKYEAEKEQL